MWSRGRGITVGPRPLVFAAVLLAGCTSEPKTVHLQSAPALADWRVVAAGVAADISTFLKERNGSSPVSLLPIEGSAVPPELGDVLLTELVLAGVPMAVESGPSATLRCRILSTQAAASPRGIVAAAEVAAEIVLLCLYAEEERYLTASRQTLSQPLIQHNAPGAIVLEITQ